MNKIMLTTGAALIAASYFLAYRLGVIAPFCFLSAGILACFLPFIAQKARDAYFADLKDRGILK